MNRLHKIGSYVAIILGQQMRAPLPQFKNDPFFLLKHHLISLIVLVPVLIALWEFHPITHGNHFWLWFVFCFMLSAPSIPLGLLAAGGCLFSLWYFQPHSFARSDALWVLAGIISGMYSSVFMHLVSHRSFKSKPIQAIIGEICSLQQLLSHHIWSIMHMVHHQYPDDPVRDPHPPLNQNIVIFGANMKSKMALHLQNFYLEHWKNNPKNKINWSLTLALVIAVYFCYALFWLLLLGPKIFTLFYITSHTITSFWYVHFNFATHRLDKDGKPQILDLEGKLYPFFLIIFCLELIFIRPITQTPPR